MDRLDISRKWKNARAIFPRNIDEPKPTLSPFRTTFPALLQRLAIKRMNDVAAGTVRVMSGYYPPERENNNTNTTFLQLDEEARDDSRSTMNNQTTSYEELLDLEPTPLAPEIHAAHQQQTTSLSTEEQKSQARQLVQDVSFLGVCSKRISRAYAHKNIHISSFS